MSNTSGSVVRAGMSGRVSEMTNIVAIKQGFTTKLGHSEQGIGLLPDEPPVRYVDNLRFALRLVTDETKKGIWIVLDDIATIHFARWVILPGDQQLMFTANFDGGWEQYIHDFVTVANSGKSTPDNQSATKWMDLVWGNCVGYPGTKDFPAFLAYIEANMVETTLWYPTITDVTVRDISWLRQFRQLFAAFEEDALRVNRESWPPQLLAAYDGFKAQVNRIDVTDV
jgi:hypothetical protein